MKKSLFWGAMAAALLLCSCNKESEQTGSKGEENYDGEYVWMDFTMELPTDAGTRSGTDWENEDEDDHGKTPSDENPDHEYGYEYENDVRTVLLVLADEDGGYLAHSDVSGILDAPEFGKEFSFTINAKFKRNNIDTAYDDGKLSGNKKVTLWAYCNYTTPIFEKFNEGVELGDTEWMNWEGTVDEGPSKAGSSPVISNTIWANRSFLMTNARKVTVGFPANKSDWDNYTNEKEPFHLSEENEKSVDNSGSIIYVERAAARLDFKDGSENETEANTYPIIASIKSPEENKDISLFKVQLTRMSLVNMSKNFYYLRRVSDDGTSEGWRVGKNETKSNYVVDTDWAKKQEVEGITPVNAGTYFNFPLYVNGPKPYQYNMTGWYVDNISSVLKGVKDTWKDQSYHIWRYVTENTIPQAEDPSIPYSQQKTVQSIGIVFKGSILPGANIDATYTSNNTEEEEPVERPYVSKKVIDALNAAAAHKVPDDEFSYPTLYLFDGLLYAGFDEVVEKAALDGVSGMLYGSVTKVLKNFKLVDKEFKWDPEGNGTALTVSIYNQIRNSGKPEEGAVNYTDGYTITLDETNADFKKAVTHVYENTLTGNFTLYEASFEDIIGDEGGWGYYCYYFYWNRHNDNQKSGVMGQMEFATVRNNVYKISVTKIGSFGHPRIPENDPDPVDPEDPDEEEKVYMDVKIEVLPWTVRVNNVEF